MTCRLLYLVGRLRDGGLERQLYYLLQAMDRKRYRPLVVVWNFRKDDKYVSRLQELNVPVYPVRGSSRWSKLRNFRNFVRSINPEVAHSYSFYTNVAAWYSSVGTKTVPIGSVRSDFNRAVQESGAVLGKLCARWPRNQIFNSFAAREKACQARSLFVPRQGIVVRNALDLDRFTFTPLPSEGRATIIGIGSFTRVKRWDRLLKAASILKQEGFTFAVQLVGEGPLRKELQKQSQDLGLADCVELISRSENIPALLSNAMLLVHTSENEGCPNVVMEAMACGRPVVCTDAGDSRSLVDDGETGFVVRKGDAGALTRCIATLISHRDLSERMGKSARAKAETEFRLDRLLTETLSAYRAAGWKESNHFGCYQVAKTITQSQ